MTAATEAFIAGLPKAELHLHIEGTWSGRSARARAEGFRLTMHCDVDQEDAVGHIWQCLDDIGVERIDHGVNCLEDAALVSRLAADRIGLTVCPVQPAVASWRRVAAQQSSPATGNAAAVSVAPVQPQDS